MSVNAYSIPFGIVLIGILSAVNLIGVKKAAEADSVLVVIKILILLIFIGFAIVVALADLSSIASHFAFSASTGNLSDIFVAGIAIIFAYSGFQSIASISGRIEGGATGASKALIAAVLISLVLYVLVVFGLLLLQPASAYTISADR